MDRVTLVLPVLITLFVNAVAMYALLLGQYHYYLQSPQFSHFDPDILVFIARLATFGNIVLIIGTSVWMIIKFCTRGQFVIAAPIATSITVIAMVIIMSLLPDSHFEYTKDGYLYREEIWRLGDKVDKYKRWKSTNSVNKLDIHNKIVWQLDSIGENY
jgi:hypothetical protein